MKRQNQNRPSPFPGRRSLYASKPGCSFLALYYVVVYFVTAACLLCCVCF